MFDEKILKSVFAKLSSEKPADDFCKRLSLRIERCRKTRTIKNVILSSILLAGSGCATFFASRLVFGDLIRSGFVDFFSMLVPDGRELIHAWQSVTFVLLESFPFMSALAVLLSVYIFLQSLRFFTYYVSAYRNSTQHVQSYGS